MTTYLSRLGITTGAALAAGLFTATGAVGVAVAEPAQHETVETHISDQNGTFDAIDHNVRTQGNSDSQGQQVKTIHNRSTGTITDPTGITEFHGTTNAGDALAPATESTGVSTTTTNTEEGTITVRCVGHFTITSGNSARSSGTVNNFLKCH
jgi:hypothetical protein